MCNGLLYQVFLEKDVARKRGESDWPRILVEGVENCKFVWVDGK